MEGYDTSVAQSTLSSLPSTTFPQLSQTLHFRHLCYLIRAHNLVDATEIGGRRGGGEFQVSAADIEMSMQREEEAVKSRSVCSRYPRFNTFVERDGVLLNCYDQNVLKSFVIADDVQIEDDVCTERRRPDRRAINELYVLILRNLLFFYL